MRKIFLCLILITSISSVFSQDREIFKVVEIMPVFPGCEIGDNHENQICTKEKLKQFIFDNLIYPDSALMMGIEGTVVVQFVVSSEGEINDARVFRDIGYGSGDAAIKTILSLNDLPQKWTPGKQRDRKGDVLYTLPVKFSLDNMIFEDAQNKPFVSECNHLIDEKEREDCTINQLWTLLTRNVRYPSEAKEKGIEGTVIVAFVIDREGNLDEFEVVKGIDAGCDEEALRAVKKISKSKLKWIPAKQNNKNVNYLYKIPVQFYLDDPIKKNKKK